MSAQDIAQFLATADKPGVLARYARLNDFDRGQVAREVARWERISNGDRARPDANPMFHGNASRSAITPPSALPRVLFDPAIEAHHDDYTPEMIAEGDRAFENISKETGTFHLQRQMGTDLDRPPEPPTMREQIEAATLAHLIDSNPKE